MRENPSVLLDDLLNLRLQFGAEAASRKLSLLLRLDRIRLPSGDAVSRLHEMLCFMRAYPDNAELLDRVRRALDRFEGRRDFRRFRLHLADTGIAGTDTHLTFFWPTARWIANRWPESLAVDWKAFDGAHRLEEILHLLATYPESPAIDEFAMPIKEWIATLRAAGESDGSFLVRRFEALPADSFLRETLYDSLGLAMTLRPGADTPSRTRAGIAVPSIAFQSGPLPSGRPSLRRVIRRLQPRIRLVAPADAERYIELARVAMVTRARDLDAFANADMNDVRLIEFDGGLQFACMGVIPERRLMLESVYGCLTLKNGVPVGYVLLSSLFGSAEIAYNVFETWRGAEAAPVFARVVALARHVFGATTFSIDPYQLGYHGNTEGLKSGAWWFYYKMGFRPRNREVKRVLRDELNAMKRNPRHRSDRRTLERLASDSVYFELENQGGVALGSLSPGNVGLGIVRLLAERHGADRERSLRECAREAGELLGVRSQAGWSAGEKLWWTRWSPLVLCLPEIESWSATDKKRLVGVIRAKGARRESDYVRRFDAHERLRNALLEMAQPD